MVRIALLTCGCLFLFTTPTQADGKRVTRLVEKFNRAIEQNDWVKAEQWLEKAKKRFPDAPTVVLMQRQAELISQRLSSDDPAERTPKRQWSPAEKELLRALEQRCSFRFQDVPLRQALEEICQTTGVNVILDELSLEQVDVSSDTPVNLETQNVRLRTTLQLMLQPLKLKYRIENEVIKIASSFRGPRLEVRTYPVADLIVPVPGTQNIRREAGRTFLSSEKELVAREAASLLELIQTHVASDSWNAASGGSIRFFPDKLSLVIRQNASIHSEIVELLEQLRKSQDTQPVIESKILTLPDSFPVVFDADGEPDESVELAFQRQTYRVLDAKATTTFMNAVQQSARGNIWSAPKVTLFNGQSIEMQMSDYGGDETELRIRAIASADRTAVRCNLTVKYDPSTSIASRDYGLTFQDGQATLIDLGKTNANNKRKLLLVSARVITDSE